MESLGVVLIGALVLVLALTLLAGNGARPVDSREPYLRDASGNIWALKVAEGTPHEDFLHTGTPHQNPAVRSEGRWWFIFRYEVEVSYYPITIAGRMLPDLEALQAQVAEAQRRGKDVALVALDAALEREVIRRENGGQLANGVTPGALAYRLNGRRR